MKLPKFIIKKPSKKVLEKKNWEIIETGLFKNLKNVINYSIKIKMFFIVLLISNIFPLCSKRFVYLKLILTIRMKTKSRQAVLCTSVGFTPLLYTRKRVRKRNKAVKLKAVPLIRFTRLVSRKSTCSSSLGVIYCVFSTQHHYTLL